MSHRENAMPEVIKWLDENKIEEGAVLELGYGNHDVFGKLFEKRGLTWTGTDKNSNIKVPMEDMPFPDNSYDIVFSCHAFEHCERPIDALREMKRVSKHWIVLLTPYHCKHQVLNADEDHISVWTEWQMRRAFKYVGIKEKSIHLQVITHREQDYNLISIGEA